VTQEIFGGDPTRHRIVWGDSSIVPFPDGAFDL
jgi:hypothetical protein